MHLGLDLGLDEKPVFSGRKVANNPKFTDIMKEISFVDHVLYHILRHSILQAPFIVDSQPSFIFIDRFLLSGFLVNSTKNINFGEIPIFSVISLIRYLNTKKNAENIFFARLKSLLKSASMIYGTLNGRNFEKLQADFEWMRQTMICHPTLSSFLNNQPPSLCSMNLRPRTPSTTTPSSSSASSSSSTTTSASSNVLESDTLSSLFDCKIDPRTTRTLCELYPGFDVVRGDPKSITLQITSGRFLEVHDPTSVVSLSAGDVILPSESTNPAYDLMVLSQRINDEGSLEDYLILIECKYSDPTRSHKIGYPVMVDKFNTLLNTYGKAGFFSHGNIKIPWKNVAFIFLTAYEGITTPKTSSASPQIPEGESSSSLQLDCQSSSTQVLDPIKGFEGVIMAADRERTCAMLGPSLNNCGAFLLEIDSLFNKMKVKKHTPST